MKKEIIIINGTGGSGKDTFVSLVSEYAKVFNFSSVDKVKEIAKLVGWNGGKEERDRKFLSDLKKLTTEYNDMAFNCCKDAVAQFKNSNDEIMFIHIREPEEIKRATSMFNAKTLLVKRKDLENIQSNYSDANVDNYEYDFIIYNNGTIEELKEKAKEFKNTILK